MTSISVLQSSWLYLYHLYQLYPLGKETSRCELVKMRKIAVMHEFWTWDLNPYLSDLNCCLLGSIFLTLWNLDSNPYLGDSNRPSHLAFCNFLERRFWQLLSIYFWHSKSAQNDLEPTTLEGFGPYLHFFRNRWSQKIFETWTKMPFFLKVQIWSFFFQKDSNLR